MVLNLLALRTPSILPLTLYPPCLTLQAALPRLWCQLTSSWAEFSQWEALVSD